MPTPARSRFLVAVLAVSTAAAAFADDAPASRILGTWNVTYTAADGSTLPARATFSAGVSPDRGSFLVTTLVDPAPPLPCGPATGSWVRVGPRRFRTTGEQLCINDGSAPDEPAVLRLVLYDDLLLTDGGNVLTGTEVLQGFDQDDHELFADGYAYAGERLRVRAAPAVPESALGAGSARRLLPR